VHEGNKGNEPPLATLQWWVPSSPSAHHQPIGQRQIPIPETEGSSVLTKSRPYFLSSPIASAIRLPLLGNIPFALVESPTAHGPLTPATGPIPFPTCPREPPALATADRFPWFLVP